MSLRIKTPTLALFSTAAFVTVAVAFATAAHAAPSLIAMGELGGEADKSGLAGTLENGLPANILGGIGSGLAYAGNDTFLALPDRGPNATPYNPKVDDTVTFIPRFNSIRMSLAPAAAGAAMPFTLKPELQSTTLLYSPTPLVYGSGEGLDVGPGTPEANAAGKFYFSGRSDGFDPAKNSCNPANARLDSEGIRVSADGKTVYVSDEYGPYLYAFDRATGARTKAFALPDNLCISTLSPSKDVEIKDNKLGRTTNKGMEGLAITPDGKTLVGVMQAATEQEDADKAAKKLIRLVSVDIATGAAHEYGYMLTEGSGVSEILAVNDHQFLLDERDGKGLGDGGDAKVKKLFLIDLAGATDITGLTGQQAVDVAVKKSEFMDLVKELGAAGITPDRIPSKIEGMAFGEDVRQGSNTLHTLYISNDNDFLPKAAGPNLFYVVGFTDADLPGFRNLTH
jgi:hypothetical protein